MRPEPHNPRRVLSPPSGEDALSIFIIPFIGVRNRQVLRPLSLPYNSVNDLRAKAPEDNPFDVDERNSLTSTAFGQHLRERRRILFDIVFGQINAKGIKVRPRLCTVWSPVGHIHDNFYVSYGAKLRLFSFLSGWSRQLRNTLLLKSVNPDA